jgi:hypothetical protein
MAWLHDAINAGGMRARTPGEADRRRERCSTQATAAGTARRRWWLPATARATVANPMKAYVITTGVVFALVTLAHILRVFAEGPRLAKDPYFILFTIAAAALSYWAWRLIRRSARS